jgi:hypothetical protein
MVDSKTPATLTDHDVAAPIWKLCLLKLPEPCRSEAAKHSELWPIASALCL